MKKIIIISSVMLLVLISSVFAQSTCEYNGIKTEFGYNYYEPGVKSEYADEQFVRMVDSKVVKTLDQLEGLTCLEHADFYNQGISGDLESLKELVNLKVISLHTNPEVYGDICVFNNAPKLKSLKLAFDEKVYGDISCLTDLNLDTFAMTYAKISGDLSDLSHMTNLKALYLSNTNVVGNISALSGLTNLEELTLSDPATEGSKFYGDLAVLDNLKKLRKASLYNMNTTNCAHFQEVHPDIEGGCSEESKSTVKDTNTLSEKLIGKDSETLEDTKKDNESKEAPPAECMVNETFIGEEECRALVGGANTGAKKDGIPEECMVNNQFIGENNCKGLMDKDFKGQSDEHSNESIANKTDNFSLIQPEKTKPQEPIEKNILQELIDWILSLFN